jgi:hypothetical protein
LTNNRLFFITIQSGPEAKVMKSGTVLNVHGGSTDVHSTTSAMMIDGSNSREMLRPFLRSLSV